MLFLYPWQALKARHITSVRGHTYLSASACVSAGLDLVLLQEAGV